ncbi:MAG: Unknown protein [uncultured Sulfurovum sp.]|uniref:Adenylate kinase n=1 Tax=uncultured Sulfurovum sp. TaxID=269237 RepID=A0A6S6SY57_9BACT|nr:MAG: Unknown protein [uncultured Sulfurovum sp.]
MKKLFLITGLEGTGRTKNARYLCDRHSECLTYYSTEGKSIDTIFKEVEGFNTKGVLLDGYPRTTEEMYALDGKLKEEEDIELTLVLNLEAKDEIREERMEHTLVKAEDELDKKNLKEIQSFYKEKGLLKVQSSEEYLSNICSVTELIVLPRLGNI